MKPLTRSPTASRAVSGSFLLLQLDWVTMLKLLMLYPFHTYAYFMNLHADV
ncbi:hypothetical protein URH17368_0095 [Alicyclobacillus hesperidum URH17-3-68]|nr:hypothetical protein URH17368_0095 [Alicyclobacillus hesperidum URH17-3-68]